jgi:hypothetical protein
LKNRKWVLDNLILRCSIALNVVRKDASDSDDRMSSLIKEQWNASYHPTVCAVEISDVASCDPTGWLPDFSSTVLVRSSF